MSRTLCSGSAVDKRRACKLETWRGTLEETASKERQTRKFLEQTAAAAPERNAARASEGRPLARSDSARNRCKVLMISRSAMSWAVQKYSRCTCSKNCAPAPARKDRVQRANEDSSRHGQLRPTGYARPLRGESLLHAELRLQRRLQQTEGP